MPAFPREYQQIASTNQEVATGSVDCAAVFRVRSVMPCIVVGVRFAVIEKNRCVRVMRRMPAASLSVALCQRLPAFGLLLRPAVRFPGPSSSQAPSLVCVPWRHAGSAAGAESSSTGRGPTVDELAALRCTSVVPLSMHDRAQGGLGSAPTLTDRCSCVADHLARPLVMYPGSAAPPSSSRLPPGAIIPLPGSQVQIGSPLPPQPPQPQQQQQQPQAGFHAAPGGVPMPMSMPMQQPQFGYAPGPAFPLFAPPPILPFTLPVHSVHIARGIFELSPVLPGELFRVLNAGEYALTIQRFQAAMRPSELRKTKRWALVFGIWTAWFLALFFIQPDVWFISLALMLLSLVGFIYSLHQHQRILSLRESRLRAIAEHETAEYNGAHRRSLFGPLGGGGWRLEWSVGRSMLRSGDPFVIYIELKQILEGEAQRFPQPSVQSPGLAMLAAASVPSTFPASPEGQPSPPSAYSQPPQRQEAIEEPGMEGRV